MDVKKRNPLSPEEERWLNEEMTEEQKEFERPIWESLFASFTKTRNKQNEQKENI